MEVSLYMKFLDNPKERKYLDENSFWIKQLNRNPNNYNKFIETMKIQYKDRSIDKMQEVINTIDIVSTVLNTFK